MYAVIETGGKQYKVGLGDRLKVEKLVVQEGESVAISRVLMVAEGEQLTLGDANNRPVQAKVLGHGRGKKIKVFKKKRRKGYRRTQGHRQDFTEIEIVGIGDRVYVAPTADADIVEQEAEPLVSDDETLDEADEAVGELENEAETELQKGDNKEE